MRVSRIVCLCLMVVSIRVACGAEPETVGTGAAGLGKGVNIRIVTKAEPPSKEPKTLKLSNRYTVAKGALHRFVVDTVNRTYFGYDIYAEPLAGATRCWIAILPLTSVQIDSPSGQASSGSAAASAGGGTPVQVDSSYRPVLLPGYPGPQVVDSGATIALDLLASPDGRQKLVDYIEVSCKPLDAIPDSQAARDFSPEDVEMHIASLSISLNGTFVSASKTADLRGSLIWFYFPGKGRFILSVAPRRRENFVQAGVIRGNVASFRFGSDHYEVKSAAAILGPGGTWRLYVLHDPSFEPKSGVAFGSAARLTELFLKR